MEHKQLDKASLAALLTSLMAEQTVFAPVLRDGVSTFDVLADIGDLAFPADGIPRVAPKQAVMPRTEVLFYYRLGKNTEKMAPPPPAEPQVLFGVHPCDVQAIKVLDAVFGAEPHPDELYLARRRVTTVVGLGVSQESVPQHRFFEKMGISSMDARDCDLFLTPLADETYVLEVLTEQGQQLLELAGELPCADAVALANVGKLRKAAEERVTREIDVDVLQEKLSGMFESEMWAGIADKCVGCGACAYLCPTCHCFDIQDERRGDTGSRVRNWDTCQFEEFTKHASGHNPRTSQHGRARQRIMHKFEYGYRNFGIPFCTGCGRCIGVCPVNNNLLTMLDGIRKSDPPSESDGSPTSPDEL
ncbi:MAG: 4Fe-4S dicluster domain-containing protein [Lentisphaerae bacterium]|jgi:sulfhydrogenase subunit beta (sulfur reductase)|nr:4Fe-4S dicluster domain-containing protein [Lentisphaerota bacterium]MBT4820055.1 4Fe-4S dicluster domain-containing protein [Lentisphaerota bacterium]MBT5606286.1 4Fe-4S dicluster domain-containing protein [Lentisphaerota bacterium]MBT7059374.1 4Fe-4S dicluster domain-containing protein [Lentisphaerota bacterium]MBT7848269.1 4Fe-4S dicluster domain-containing protein [Lentisphaerota bacterium]